MESIERPEFWLSLWLLMTLVGSSLAQPPRPEKPPEEGEVRLPALLSGKPLKVDPEDDEQLKLLKGRYNEAVGEAKAIYQQYFLGRATSDELYGSLQRVVQGGLELSDNSAEKVALLRQYAETTVEVEKFIRALHDAHKIRIRDLHRARYEHLNAEILLNRAKREADKAKEK
jgi:hypothetical protein